MLKRGRVLVFRTIDFIKSRPKTVFFLASAVLVFLSLYPKTPRVLNVSGGDKWAHLIAYAAWGGLLFLSFNASRRRITRLVIVSLAALFFGGVIEILQRYAGRNPDLADIVANVTGSVLGVFLLFSVHDGLLAAVKTILIYAALAFAAVAVFVITINVWVVDSTRDFIFEKQEGLSPASTILILGAAVYPGNRVSQITYDRLITGAEVYKKGLSGTILVSGDNSTVYYDEVTTIKSWLIRHAIPEDNIHLDYAGFSTYDSVYRAREIFQAGDLIIVTQAFHLPRAVYLARHLGFAAQGIVADRVDYASEKYNHLREALARTKDFINIHVLRPLPKFLGEVVPIHLS